jgi:hypothetical protein
MTRDERGSALALAVFVLTIIGALVVAAFFAGVQEHRMSDATRRLHRSLGQAEAQLAGVLRQWPDDAGNLDPYPQDSMVLGPSGAVVRRMADDLYFVSVAENALGMLIFRAAPCPAPAADELEMTPSNCLTDNILQKTSVPRPVTSRSLVHSF